MKVEFKVNYPAWAHLKIATLFGLLSGLIEISVHLIKKYVLHKFIFMGVDAFWIIPLTNTILFIGFGFALLVVYKILPRIESSNLTIFLFATLSYFISLTVGFDNISKIAFLILAFGLSKQTVSFINSNAKFFNQLILNKSYKTLNPEQYEFQKSFSNNIGIFIGCGIVLLVLFVSVQLGQAINEKLKYNQLPPISSKMPNVLLIVLDTVRSENLSLLGYQKNTAPHLTEISESGVVFTQAFSPSPWTLPTHGSLFTGQYPSKLSADFEVPLDDTYPTIAEILRDNGYLTAGFVANTVYCSSETGLDRGFIHYEDYSVSIRQAINDSQLLKWLLHSRVRHFFGDYQVLGRKNAAEINDNFYKWLSRNRTNRPFFVFINYYDAHDPYIPPTDFNSLYPSEPSGGNLKGLGADYTEQELMELKNSYDESIRYLDYQLGQLFIELEKLNLDDTLIIIVSDHGEQFGEHGLVSHANSLYSQLLHVPLIILAPDAPNGIQIDKAISTIDIPKTILDYIGLQEASIIPGNSLASYWNKNLADGGNDSLIFSEANPGKGQPEWYPTAKGPMKSLIFNGYHYIRNGDGSEELYELESDPTEANNLASEENEEILMELRLIIKTLAENK